MRKHILTPLVTLTILLFSAVAIISCSKKNDTSGNTYIPPTPPDTTKKTDTTKYSLVWADEFNGNSVDTTKWHFETGNLHVNNEEEYYQASNATVANGMLMITAKNQGQGGQPYTSARMNTSNKFNVTYGKIEARIKLPIGAGLWPAFWMLGSNINSGVNWPSCGEIDILEHINTDSLIHGSLHWSSGGQEANTTQQITTSPGSWHVYSITWTTSSISFYVDNTMYDTENIANDVNSTDAFHKPFFIILNLATGGDWPGSFVDTTQLPATMYVDYVRVYQGSN